ncbi:NAD(P)-dependent oxidoreductase [Brevibacillus marinus]|uniref:NAD(P)-dependent oxidoreductase n=1 Tax=Brevibacillus marinus TaxID=2496837 RepID=UPI000F83CE8A|nr:NAD(P)-dependent oxidoreductase [Brevibacillus marinus]
METVGFIGIGMMGKGMISSLLRGGYRVYACDTDPQAAAWAAEQGAVPCATPREAARASRVVFTSLPGPSAVEAVLLGEDGVLQGLPADGCILDTSTIDPATARRLHQAASARGIRFFDCPVSGGPAGANAGTLTVMVGGDEEQLPAALPYLRAIGKEIIYLGEAGSGQVAKLCHNALVASITTALGEALLVGKKAGVSPEKLARVIENGSAQNRVLSVFGPNILQGTYENAIFALHHMHKDLRLYADTARQCQAPLLVASSVIQLYEAAQAQGKGAWDSSAVCSVLEALADNRIAR